MGEETQSHRVLSVRTRLTVSRVVADWAHALTNVSHMNWEMIVGLSAVPWLKLVRSVCKRWQSASNLAFWDAQEAGVWNSTQTAHVTHRLKAELRGGTTW
jgi:hypothetical protein